MKMLDEYCLIFISGAIEDIGVGENGEWTSVESDREWLEFECWSKATRMFSKNDSEKK